MDGVYFWTLDSIVEYYFVIVTIISEIRTSSSFIYYYIIDMNFADEGIRKKKYSIYRLLNYIQNKSILISRSI